MAVHDKRKKNESAQDELVEILSQQEAIIQTTSPVSESLPEITEPLPLESIMEIAAPHETVKEELPKELPNTKDYLLEIKKEIESEFAKLSPRSTEQDGLKVCQVILGKTHLPEEERKAVIGEMMVRLTALQYQKLKTEEKRIKDGIASALERIERAVSSLQEQYKTGIVDLGWKKDFKLFTYEHSHRVEMFKKPAVSDSDVASLKTRIKLDECDWNLIVDASSILNMVKGISALIRQYRNLAPQETQDLKVGRLELITFLIEGEILFVEKTRKIGDLLIGLAELLQTPRGVNGRGEHPELLTTLSTYPDLVAKNEAHLTYIRLVGMIMAE